jgi:putative colanic acid biosynthesis glycosyltransferase
MRILYINSVCKRGSTGKIAYSLYTAANANGDTAGICYGRGAEIKEKNIFKFGLDWETVLHAGLTRVTGWTGRFSHLSTGRLLRFMDEFAPDIVHLHEPHAYFIDLAPFFEYIRAHNIPLVYTFHCEFAYTGKCGVSNDCTRWKDGCGSCPELRKYPKTLMFDHTAAMWQEKKRLLSGLNMTICTPSKWLAERVKESFLGGYDVHVIPNGIDTELFRPRPYEHLRARHGLGDEKIVLAVAPYLMDKSKGGRDVLRLAESMRDENIKFILIGVDDTSEKFPDNVIALGRTENQQELAEYYSMADVFVMCSQMENLPTTCIEAVCCGTPVAGFDVGGTAEIAPAPLGLYCSHGDIDALRENVRQLLATKIEPEKFEASRNHFSFHRMFSDYDNIYREMLKDT